MAEKRDIVKILGREFDRLHALFILIAIVVIVGVGAFAFNQDSDQNEGERTDSAETAMVDETAVTETTVSEDGATVSYNGVNGQTALELLENSDLTVVTEDSSVGEFVSKIGDLGDDDSGKFWAFYVNDELASVGAGDYETVDEDVIEWRFE